MGFGSGMTCWRRLRDWQAAGVWEQLHHAMLIRLREHDQIDWERASIDGSTVPSPPGGPTNRSQPNRQGQTGLQTAYRRRRSGHSVGGVGQQDQSARLNAVRVMH